MSSIGEDGSTSWRNLKQRLSFKSLACCGGLWDAPKNPTMPILDHEDQEEQPIIQLQNQEAVATNMSSLPGMNLATELAAERNMPGGNKLNNGKFKTLIRLIEETDGVDLRKNNNKKKKKNSNKIRELLHEEIMETRKTCDEWVCCVCMESKKGAAFIPCGHAFCRSCSRDLWLNRGSCPICNSSILDILDIF